ncbi:hypothetical protein [Burkholderia sp. BE17]|uniref:hypothetical protein n=1 Tax=Burkholderia sp. BE17 TaxID=2656644 RepID=UPI00128D7EBF|nr:hypothetical protein [Burkholderia sp. BE17]MPV71487.1 hypothetical protein [Burkholderia sp. BE17]
MTRPIQITLTLGALPDSLKDLDTYGQYLQAFNSDAGLEPPVCQENLYDLPSGHSDAVGP